METNVDDTTIPALSKHRIEALTDGIYAIAMTLPVLNIDAGALPTITIENITNPEFYSFWPQLFHYIIAFMVLGAFWIAKHQEFHYIRHVDFHFLWCNMFSLFFVALIPFSTALVGDYSDSIVAVQFFGMNMFLIGIVNAYGWRYARKDQKMFHDYINIKKINHMMNLSLVIPAISLLMVFAAIFIPEYASMLFFMIPVVHMLMDKGSKNKSRDVKS